MARKKSLIVAMLDDYDKRVRQQAAEQKRMEALKARLERERQRQERAMAKQKAAEEKAREEVYRALEKERAEALKIYDRYRETEKRYNSILTELSSMAYQNADSEQIDHGIVLSSEAVSLVPEMMDFYLRLRKMRETRSTSSVKDLYSIDDFHMPFSILADLYACQRRYPYAIRTCKDAMEFGFTSYDDHTTYEEMIQQIESEMEDTDDGEM